MIGNEIYRIQFVQHVEETDHILRKSFKERGTRLRFEQERRHSLLISPEIRHEHFRQPLMNVDMEDFVRIIFLFQKALGAFFEVPVPEIRESDLFFPFADIRTDTRSRC